MKERKLAKNAARRSAIIRHRDEVTHSAAKTCRYYGTSRQVFYTWLRRYEAEGEYGLRDRSKRPLSSPQATKTEVINKIVKDLGLKAVTSQAQGDHVRVQGKKRDDLQAVIAKLKAEDLGIPLQFGNFRD